MPNIDEYLTTFSEIETHLARAAAADGYLSPVALVRRLERTNRAVRVHADDICKFAELRNVLVHERRNGKVLAQPTDETVADIKKIAQALNNPPRVIPLFDREVVSLEKHAPIGAAVSIMRKLSLSQIPITSGSEIVGLLTAETVARWLAAELSEEIVSLTETAIEAVLPHAESDDQHKVLAPRASLYDALQLFEDYSKSGKNLHAILVTNNGKQVMPILGIMTTFDIPKILMKLGIQSE